MSKRILALLAIAAMVFAACSSTATNAPGSTPTAAPPTTLIMGEWQPASQLNPFFTTSFGDFEAIQHLLTTAYKKSSFHYDWTFNDRKNKPLSLQTQKLTPHVIPPDALSTSNPDLSDEIH